MQAGDRKQGINCWPCHSVEVEPSLQTFIRGIFFSIDRLMLKDGPVLMLLPMVFGNVVSWSEFYVKVFNPFAPTHCSVSLP